MHARELKTAPPGAVFIGAHGRDREA